MVYQDLAGGCGNLPYNHGMSMFKNPLILGIALLPVSQLKAQQHVSFAAEDGGKVCADLYGKEKRAVILVHGGRFRKESWRPQAEMLAAKGFKVVAFDFRGFGCSKGHQNGR